MTASTNEILWRPPADQQSRLGAFLAEVAHHPDVLAEVQRDSGLDFASYADAWTWSTTDLDAFWLAVWRYFDIPSATVVDHALQVVEMPGARWFPQARLNYAETMLRMPGRADDDVVLISRSQSREEQTVSAAQLRDQVARARTGLKRLGVGHGDRVAAYAPNIPETFVLLLAAASLGAVFTSCAPEFGAQSVQDRWQQITPKVVLAIDGYRYGSKGIDRRTQVDQILSGLPSVERPTRRHRDHLGRPAR